MKAITAEDGERLQAIHEKIQELAEEYYQIVEPDAQELNRMETLIPHILYYLRHEANEPLGDCCAKYVIAHRVLFTRNMEH